MKPSNSPETVLILGSGIAGLSLALRLAEHRHVTVVAKTTLDQSNTWRAQGGLAAVVSDDDSIDAHVEDTMNASAGAANRRVAETIIAQGDQVVQDLLRWGVQFSKEAGGNDFDLAQEGGHSFRRILHAGDLTGAAIGQALLASAQAHPRITLIENHMAVDLITKRREFKSQPDSCLGAYLLNTVTNKIEPWLAGTTVLATGGSGKVYLYTSNPDVATGDGLAMAYRAGCRAVNMEFTQFHPTCLFHPDAKNFLISEAVRGEGGLLLNAEMQRFMPEIHPRAELAPRDIVARAIDAEIKRLGANCVYLDISHKSATFIESRFPNLLQNCLDYGFDMREQPIPVVPAAHYQCGGIWADTDGSTSIPNLYAVGEVAHTGLHGANRLASNSLLEGLAMSKFASEKILAAPNQEQSDFENIQDLQWVYGDAVPADEQVIVSHNWEEVRRTMSSYVGIVRSERRLARAERRIATLAEEVQEYYWGVIPNKDLLELRNLVQVAWIIIQSAKRRQESRGLHYTLDFPETKLNFQNTVLDPLSHYP